MADPGGMGMLSVSHRMAVVSVQWFIQWRIQGGGVIIRESQSGCGECPVVSREVGVLSGSEGLAGVIMSYG